MHYSSFIDTATPTNIAAFLNPTITSSDQSICLQSIIDMNQFNMLTFLCMLSFEGIQNLSQNHLSQIFKYFSFWIEYFTIYSFYCVLWYYVEFFYSCGEKCVSILCLWYFLMIQKVTFPFLHVKRAYKYWENIVVDP